MATNEFISMMKEIKSAMWTAGTTPALFHACDAVEEELRKQSGLSREEWNSQMGYDTNRGLGESERIPSSVRNGAVKLTVMYEAYERMAQGDICLMHIEGDNLRDGLFKLLDYRGFQADREMLEEKEEELGRECTTEEIMDLIDEYNGDGWDCILFIKNDYTDEFYYNHDFFQESYWDGETKIIIA